MGDSNIERAAWVGVANAVGRSVESVGIRLFKLDAESLLNEARRKTGLSDFGAETFREGFEILCRALVEEGQLTPIGRYLAHQEILTVLVNRLQVTEWVRRYPKIRTEEIREPLFVTGTPRSGTSILHELLSQDLAHRPLLTWESHYPCPPPEEATRHTDPRIQRSERRVRLWDRMIPSFRAMHEMGGAIPQECIFLTDHDFKSEHQGGSYNLASYNHWLGQADMRAALEYHKLHLQLLQWRCAKRRWVLKAPAHLGNLPEIFDIYPDARLIWTHRDPVTTISSGTNVMRALVALHSDAVPSAKEVAPDVAMGCEFRFRQAIEQRAKGLLPEAQVADILYQNLMDDPGGALAGVYAKFGMDFPVATREGMLDYLRGKPKGKFGRHQHTLEGTGLDREELRERFAFYIRQYGIAVES